MVRRDFALAVGTGALVAVTGCGGNSEHSVADDDAGTGGTGATGGSTTAGSGGGGTSGNGGSPPLTQRAAAAFELSLHPSSLSSRTCPGTYTFSIGEPKPGGTIADRDGDTGVTCTVTAGGVVHAVVGGSDNKTRETVGFSLDAVLARDVPSISSVHFFSLQTLTLWTLDGFPGCTVGTVTTVKAGAVLLDLQCPVLASPDDGTTACAAEGTVAFEYCATEE